MADIEYYWSEYIKAGSEALVLLRTLYPLLPTQSRDEVEAKIEAAQQALEIANAKIAQELGFHISRLRVSTGSNALQQGRERTSLFEVRIYRKLQSRPSACPRGECCLSVSIAVTGGLRSSRTDRGAQVLPPAGATVPPWLPAKSARASNLPACCALEPLASAAQYSCRREPCTGHSAWLPLGKACLSAWIEHGSEEQRSP